MVSCAFTPATISPTITAMKMSREQFLKWEHKAVTLLGMSGVGKTTLAYHLPQSTWFHFSGDYRIGTKYLEEPILDNVKRQAMQVGFLRDLLRSDSIYIASNITVHNLEPIAAFLGKIGNPDLGGLPVDEFKRRQRLHYDAEIKAMRDVEHFVHKGLDIYGYPHFVNDAGGSVCELDDQSVLDVLARNTLIIYLKTDKHMEEVLIERAKVTPKPLFYREEFLDKHLANYLKLNKLESPNEIVPDEFVQWVFPRLLEHRRPRYEAIADQYGYSIDANQIEHVHSEQDFIDLVGDALKKSERAAA